MTRSLPLNDKLKVVPYDCVIVDNMRTMIKTRINEQSDKKAVVIGINPSVACEGKSDTTLTKISKYLYQYGIGEIAMINLFETISTEQNGIDYNQKCLLEKHEQLLKDADLIVVAWGTEDKYLDAKEMPLDTCFNGETKFIAFRIKRVISRDTQAELHIMMNWLDFMLMTIGNIR